MTNEAAILHDLLELRYELSEQLHQQHAQYLDALSALAEAIGNVRRKADDHAVVLTDTVRRLEEHSKDVREASQQAADSLAVPRARCVRCGRVVWKFNQLLDGVVCHDCQVHHG